MSAASGKRIAEVLEEKADIVAPPKPLDRVEDGSIDFDHVTFSYRQGSGGKTLSDIDLHIKSGESIGIIGGTGCGKSSLVSLISRLYDVTSGSVKVAVRMFGIMIWKPFAIRWRWSCKGMCCSLAQC